jgi:methionyl-tRNA formyltransferase
MMRCAVAATDRYIGVVHALVNAGWDPIKLFITPVDDRLHKNKGIVEWAQKRKMAVQLSPLDSTALRHLQEDGCEALVVASYSWRIPEWRSHLKYAVNFHPSPLPEGRGPDPTVRALLENRQSWTVTCHKIEHAFDSGDILDAESFALESSDCRDTLDLKIQMAATRLATRVATGFTALWDSARPQGPGSYWKNWTPVERTLSFSDTVEAVLRRVRAFGAIECVAVLNKITIFVKSAVGWRESHQHAPGTVVYENDLRFVVAVQDGYVAIMEWSLLAPGARSGNAER